MLTLGFARRLATYKRLHLLIQDPERFLRLLEAPAPDAIAVRRQGSPRATTTPSASWSASSSLKSDPRIGGRVAFLEDYDMGLGEHSHGRLRRLDQPAAAAAGSERHQRHEGRIQRRPEPERARRLVGRSLRRQQRLGDRRHRGRRTPTAKDARDAAALLDLLEREVIPLFYDRDAAGIPRGWIARIKASLRTIGPRFCATRMLDEYVQKIYSVR